MARFWALILGVGFICAANAQMPRLDSAVRVALETPKPEPPLTITPAGTNKLSVKRAENFDLDGDNVQLSGNVEFTYGEYTGTCDDVVGNLNTEEFTLRGHVKLVGPDISYEGEKIEANFKSEQFKFKSAKSALKPALIQGKLNDDLYVTGQAGDGTQKDFTLTDGTATTCEYDDPHYQIAARSIRVLPGDRIVLRDARLELLGKTILGLPYMSFPLGYTAPRYIPEVGQTRDEGYFIKTRFGVDVPGDNLLDGRLDYMSKLGFGIGSEYFYRAKGQDGALKLYKLFGPNPSTTANLNHVQQIGRLSINSNLDFSERNYLTSPKNTTFNGRTSLSWSQIGSQTRLTLGYQDTKSPNFRNTNQTATLSDTRTFKGGLQSSIDLNFTDYKSASTSFNQTRKILDVRTRLTKKFKTMDAELAYLRTVPISEIVNFFSATDQTPMFTLRSDTARMFGWKSLPIQTQFSIGELVDSIRRQPLTRTVFEAIVPQQNLKLGSSTLNLAGRFKQGIYSDNTAQFVFGADANYNLPISKGTGLNIRYNYLRPQGYSPLSIDRTGRTDAFGGDVTMQIGNQLKAAVTAGYDLLAQDRNFESSWQSVGTRLEWNPSKNLLLRSSANYDTFSQVWSNVRLDLQLMQGETRLSVGARFDGQRHTWGTVNFYGEGMRWGRLTTQALFSYNGYTEKFESRQVAFLYDLHCMEAIVEVRDQRTGFRNGTSFAFYLRIKALPFKTPFGFGTQGQGFGTGTGTGF